MDYFNDKLQYSKISFSTGEVLWRVALVKSDRTGGFGLTLEEALESFRKIYSKKSYLSFYSNEADEILDRYNKDVYMKIISWEEL